MVLVFGGGSDSDDVRKSLCWGIMSGETCTVFNVQFVNYTM